MLIIVPSLACIWLENIALGGSVTNVLTYLKAPVTYRDDVALEDMLDTKGLGQWV